MTTVEKTVRQKMEEAMSVSWSGIDSLLGFYTDSESGSELAWADEWASGKERFFKAFGEKLRIEQDVELKLSDDEVTSEIRSLIETLSDNRDISPRTVFVVATFFSIVNIFEVVENSLTEKREVFGTSFGKGMKLSRAIGRLIKDGKERDIFQTEFSKVLQSFKAFGKMVISVDPVDILAMSFNPDGDWRSCHNIYNGEYRTGPVSYLLDETTFVAYVYKRDAERNGIAVPNKAWRQIGYLSKDESAVVLSTHYPCQNQSNERNVVSTLDNIFSVHQDGYLPSYHLSRGMTDRSSYHYNDISSELVDNALLVQLEKSDGSVEAFYNDKLDDYGDGFFKIGAEDIPAYDGGFVCCTESLFSDSDECGCW